MITWHSNFFLITTINLEKIGVVFFVTASKRVLEKMGLFAKIYIAKVVPFFYLQNGILFTFKAHMTLLLAVENYCQNTIVRMNYFSSIFQAFLGSKDVSKMLEKCLISTKARRWTTVDSL